METLLLEYDAQDAMAQKVVSFIRSLGIFKERQLDLEEAIRDIQEGNTQEYASVDDFFAQNNLL